MTVTYGVSPNKTNPYLAHSPWPITHMNSWLTDSSPFSGP